MKEKLFSDVEKNIEEIQERVHIAAKKAGRDPKEIRLMAVTKTVDPALVNHAVQHGVHLIGENRAQELLEKYPAYELKDTEIHFIGSLQSNKVRQIIDKVSMIHSVDRISLAKEINRQAKKCGKPMDILMQVNIGKEDSKSGVEPEEALSFAKKLEEYPYLRLRGLMAIPPICETKEESAVYFSQLKKLLVDISRQNKDNGNVSILSMGMSNDFETAIEHGATIIRIGTALFGERP